MITIVFAANIFQGTFGAGHDLHLMEDFRTVLGPKRSLEESTDYSLASAPHFPFIRDFVSWVLLATIIIGIFLLHRQAQKMSVCLSKLAANGAIISRSPIYRLNAAGEQELDAHSTFRLTMTSRLLGIDSVVSGVPPHDAFNAVIARANLKSQWCAHTVLALLIILAAALAWMLKLGTTNEFFLALAPPYPDSSIGDVWRQHWLKNAYDSWWASSNNPLGNILYSAFAFVAFLVVLCFQPVGLFVLYIVVGMKHTTDWSADWSNRDGCYGWRPVAEVYRTVLQAVSLLGVAISVMLLMLGIHNFKFVIGAVVLYTLVAPLFIFLPRIVWRNVAETAKAARITDLTKGLSNFELDNPRDNLKALVILHEIDRCERAEIAPTRVKRLWTSVGFTALGFPLLLTLFQLAFPMYVGTPAN